MSYQNSVAIIRTRKDSVVGCHMIFTNRYVAANRHQFVYRGYPCSEFHIAETEGGDVIVTTFDVMPQSKVQGEDHQSDSLRECHRNRSAHES